MPGIFITFEGVEGCGKSTQAVLLHRRLKKRLGNVVLTKEPGGTRTGRQVRKVLLNPGNTGLVPLAEFFLYLADRSQHVQELITPVLVSGGTVICDRHADASVAYQGVGRKIGFGVSRKLNRMATRGLEPDLTFFLDVPPEEGLRRALGRKRLPDRMERERIAFHRSVRRGYVRLAKVDRKRIKVIDGLQPRNVIHGIIADEVDKLLRPGKRPGQSLISRGKTGTSGPRLTGSKKQVKP